MIIQKLSETDESKFIYEAAQQISKLCKEESFFALPYSKIESVIKVVDFHEENDPYPIIKNIIAGVSKHHPTEAVLLLNILKKEKIPLNSLQNCISILSCFYQCDICTELETLFDDEQRLPERDWEYDLQVRDKQIADLQAEIERLKQQLEEKPSVRPRPHPKANIPPGDAVYKPKVVLLGDDKVGKSCIVNQRRMHVFDADYLQTIGAAFSTFDEVVNGEKVTFQIWDCAGAEKYRSLIPMYNRESKIQLIFFDVTNRNSFDHLHEWMNIAKESTGQIVIIGNKIDLSNQRVVTCEEALAYAKKNKVPYYETSAKNPDDLSDLLVEISTNLSNEQSTDKDDHDSDPKKKDCRI